MFVLSNRLATTDSKEFVIPKRPLVLLELKQEPELIFFYIIKNRSKSKRRQAATLPQAETKAGGVSKETLHVEILLQHNRESMRALYLHELHGRAGCQQIRQSLSDLGDLSDGVSQ